MSDNGSVVIRNGSEQIVLHTAHMGTELPDLVRVGLSVAFAEGRERDFPYLNRILFCHMMDESDLYSSLGFSISVLVGPIPGRVIYIDAIQSTIRSEDYDIPLMPLKQFVRWQAEETWDKDEEDL